MKKYLLYFLWLYIIGYTILLIFNLEFIPLVWFDEVMGLDPAVNLVFKDGFTSKIWPQTGTEDAFMAYLPVRFIFHSFHLSELPFTVFWQRLPWAVYFLCSIGFIIYAARVNKLEWILALVVGFIFMNDKTVFEVARSMRIDPLSLMLLAFTGLAYFKQKYILQAILSSILVFVHPNLWFIALILFFDASIKWNKKKPRKALMPNVLWIFPLCFFALYLYSIDLQVDLLYTQLFEHGSEHSASGGILDRLKDHFYSRFWPYYISQPYMPLIIYTGLGSSIYQIIKKRQNALDIALVGTHLYWLFVLAPFYRYNAVLLTITILSLLPHLSRIKLNSYSLGFILLLCLIHPANVMARHAMAIAQQNERDPKPVLAWLNTELENKNCLIYGHDVAYYAVATKRHQDYMMFNLLPPKHNYKDYDEVFFLSSDSSLDQGLLHVSTYHPEETKAPAFLKKLFYGKPTYSSLYLFKLESEEAFDQNLKKLDENNESVNRPKDQ